MDFSSIFQSVLGQIIVQSLFIGIVVAQLRQSVKYVYPKAETIKLYREVFLPLLPIALGAGTIYLAHIYKWTLDITYFQGTLAGFCSGTAFRILRAYLAAATTKYEAEAAADVAKTDMSISPLPGDSVVPAPVVVTPTPAPAPVPAEPTPVTGQTPTAQ